MPPVDLEYTTASLDVVFGQGEHLIRADPVVVRHSSTTGWWPNTPPKHGLFGTHRALMVITNRRLLFLQPPLTAKFDRIMERLIYVPVLGSVAAFFNEFWPPSLAGRVAFELSAIDRLWAWQSVPRTPPMFQVGAESWTFRLAVDNRRRPRFAATQDVEEHLLALESAWSTARAVGHADR
jgi:hypothetical protein